MFHAIVCKERVSPLFLFDREPQCAQLWAKLLQGNLYFPVSIMPFPWIGCCFLRKNFVPVFSSSSRTSRIKVFFYRSKSPGWEYNFLFSSQKVSSASCLVSFWGETQLLPKNFLAERLTKLFELLLFSATKSWRMPHTGMSIHVYIDIFIIN